MVVSAHIDSTYRVPGGVPTAFAKLGLIQPDRFDSQAASIRRCTLTTTHRYLGYTPFAGARPCDLVDYPGGMLGAIAFAMSAPA